MRCQEPASTQYHPKRGSHRIKMGVVAAVELYWHAAIHAFSRSCHVSCRLFRRISRVDASSYDCRHLAPSDPARLSASYSRESGTSRSPAGSSAVCVPALYVPAPDAACACPRPSIRIRKSLSSRTMDIAPSEVALHHGSATGSGPPIRPCFARRMRSLGTRRRIQRPVL
jgi:hypothetical protein